LFELPYDIIVQIKLLVYQFAGTLSLCREVKL